MMNPTYKEKMKATEKTYKTLLSSLKLLMRKIEATADNQPSTSAFPATGWLVMVSVTCTVIDRGKIKAATPSESPHHLFFNF